MADDNLNNSEDLFMFLHNPPACLRPSVNVPKKPSRFFFSTLFKGCVLHWFLPSIPLLVVDFPLLKLTFVGISSTYPITV